MKIMVDRRGALWFNATVILLWPGDDRGVFWEEFYYERMQQAAVAAKKSKMSVRDICYAGLFAAVIAVMAQISIPMPMGVPMTMQTFAITLAAVVLGSKLSTISSLIYIIMGAVGLPVLANFSGGFDKFVGPTGGFLISFP